MNYTMTRPRLDLAAAMMDYSDDMSQFIADSVLPVWSVAKKTANFSVISPKNKTTNNNTASNGGELNIIESKASETYYNCLEYGLKELVTKEDRAVYSSEFDCDVVAYRTVKLQNMIAREIRVASACFNTTTFATGNGNFIDVSSSGPWATTSTDVLSQLKTARMSVYNKTGTVPDTLTMSYSAMETLMLNDDIVARCKDGVVTYDLLKSVLASVCGFRKINIGMSTYDTGNEGQDYSGAAVWSASYVLVHKTASPNMPGLGWSFEWNDPTILSGPSEYYSDDFRGTFIQDIEWRDEVVYDTGKYGYLMQIA